MQDNVAPVKDKLYLLKKRYNGALKVTMVTTMYQRFWLADVVDVFIRSTISWFLMKRPSLPWLLT